MRASSSPASSRDTSSADGSSSSAPSTRHCTTDGVSAMTRRSFSSGAAEGPRSAPRTRGEAASPHQVPHIMVPHTPCCSRWQHAQQARTTLQAGSKSCISMPASASASAAAVMATASSLPPASSTYGPSGAKEAGVGGVAAFRASEAWQGLGRGTCCSPPGDAARLLRSTHCTSPAPAARTLSSPGSTRLLWPLGKRPGWQPPRAPPAALQSAPAPQASARRLAGVGVRDAIAAAAARPSTACATGRRSRTPGQPAPLLLSPHPPAPRRRAAEWQRWPA